MKWLRYGAEKTKLSNANKNRGRGGLPPPSQFELITKKTRGWEGWLAPALREFEIKVTDDPYIRESGGKPPFPTSILIRNDPPYM